MTAQTRIPVTVLTGFLGSGKTTLVNRILSERHGKRIAVIENEFGEVGVDQQLVIGAEEEIFETANGCICCTVRGDLIRVLGQLMKRRDRFDYIMIETTGLADPGPVAQTFFVDEDLKEHFSLDAIVTVVDARHIEQHLAELAAPGEQVAFADVILLNKTDLVGPSDIARVERRLRSINAGAKLFHTHNAQVPVDSVLHVGAFDLGRILAVNASFLEPEYPFEWAGLYRLDAGAHTIRAGREAVSAHGHEPVVAHDHDHSGLGLLVLPAAAAELGALASLLATAVEAFGDPATPVASGGTLAPGQLQRLDVSHGAAEFSLRVSQPGAYAVFCEHAPAEYSLALSGCSALAERLFASHHHHDEDIGSVGISDPRPLDAHKLDAWLSYLLQSRGADILRMKGVLNIRGEDRRYVFHGVHMTFDGALAQPWNGAPRANSLVFIGRRLDRLELEAGFAACIA